jgi:hypothetical protein
MNDRLNYLRISAGIARLEGDPRLVVINKEGQAINGLIGLELFAEAIIKDCIDICEQTHDTPNGNMRCANDDESIRKIKQHFGVE